MVEIKQQKTWNSLQNTYSVMFPYHLLKETSEIQKRKKLSLALRKIRYFFGHPWYIIPMFHFGFTEGLFKTEFGSFSPRWPSTFTAMCSYAHIFYMYVKHIPQTKTLSQTSGSLPDFGLIYLLANEKQLHWSQWGNTCIKLMWDHVRAMVHNKPAAINSSASFHSLGDFSARIHISNIHGPRNTF